MKNQPTFSEKLKRCTLLLALVLLSSAAFPQTSPPIQWQKSLGGTKDDYCTWLQQTADGGYVMAGSTFSNDGDVSGHHGEADSWISKLDATGVLEWQNTMGGTAYDWTNSIQQTNDGGFIAAGGSESNDGDVTGNHGSSDYWIVKLDSTGMLEWQKSLGGTSHEDAYAILETTEGGFVVAGYSNSNNGDVSGNHGSDDYWIVKLNSAGTIEWQKSLGGTSWDIATSIQQTNDGGYVVAGYSNSNDGDVSGNHGASDYWIVKLDSTGTLEWQKSLGGTYWDYAYSIQQTADGGLVVAGSSDSNDGDVSGNHGYDDYWIVKLNSIGALEWQVSLGGSSTDYAVSIQQTTEGGFVVAGATYSTDGDVSGNHGYDDYWIVKLDSMGTLEWQKSLGGASSDFAFFIVQTSDGRFMVAGSSFSNDGDVLEHHGSTSVADCWLVKLYSCGSLVTLYADQDGDGYGSADVSITTTVCPVPDGYLPDSTDCNDGNAAINPGQPELCNNIDDDCNGILDEGAWYIYYQDADHDGYGGGGSSVESCAPPAGYVANTDDCDDANPGIHPFPPAILWQRLLGGSDDEYPSSSQQTTDGGFVVAGSSHSNDGDVSGWHPGYDDQGNPTSDYWIVKLDSTGIIEWQKSLGGSKDDFASSIQQTTDGGYVVAGESYSNDGDVTGHHGSSLYPDYWIVKLDSNGTLQGQKSLGGFESDRAHSIQQTSDGGLVVAGASRSNDGDVSGNHGVNDYWILKLNSNGTLEWQKSLGGTDHDYASSILQTADGGFMVAGYSESNDGDVSENHGNYDYWIVKLDSNGTLEGQKSLGGFNDDLAQSIQKTADGGFVVAGSSYSNNGDVSGHHGNAIHADYWIVKLGPSGIMEWQKSLGGTDNDFAVSIQQTTDGGYVVAGDSRSNDGDVSGHHGSLESPDSWIVELDAAGNIKWQKSMGGKEYDYARSIHQTPDGGFMAAGNSHSNDGDVSGNHGGYDYWIVKLKFSPGGIEICNNADDNCDGNIDENCICPAPSNLAESNITATSARLSWDGIDGVEGYRVRYREVYSPNWYITATSGPSKKIKNLLPNTGYVWQAFTFCSASAGLASDWSTQEYFHTAVLKSGESDVQQPNLIIFPNPTAGSFVLELLMDEAANSEATIQFLNMLGQVVYHETTSVASGMLREEIQFNDTVAEGMYLVKVTINDKVFTAQIDLQK